MAEENLDHNKKPPTVNEYEAEKRTTIRRQLIKNLVNGQRLANLDDDQMCRAKAIQRNQMMFTLVEQDRSAPRTIAFWIMENIETAPADKLFDALLDALLMRKYHSRKDAD